MKTFPSDTLVMVHPKWQKALNLAGHLQQAHVLVIAENKAQAEQMIAANTSQGHAWHLVRGLKLRRDSLSTSDQALVDAGIVSLKLPGVFAYYASVRGCSIIQALPDGTCPVVGYFRMGDGLGDRLYAERATGDSE